MPFVDTSIWLAQRAAIIAAAGTLPIAWPDEDFTPPTTATALLPFLAVGKATAPPRRVLIGKGAHDRNGVLTLIFVAPVGKPAEWHIEKAAQIAAQFPEDRCMTHGAARLRVTSRPLVADAYRDGGYLRTPIIINWRAFA